MLGSIRFPLTSIGVVTTVALLSAVERQGARRRRGGVRPHAAQLPLGLADSQHRHPRRPHDPLLPARQQEIYRTYLPRECPGLERNDRFAYEARNSQLCDVDVITVLEQIGVSLTPSFTCRLGEFIPITARGSRGPEARQEDRGLEAQRDPARSPRSCRPKAQRRQDAAADDAAEADEAAARTTAADAARPRQPAPRNAARGAARELRHAERQPRAVHGDRAVRDAQLGAIARRPFSVRSPWPTSATRTRPDCASARR